MPRLEVTVAAVNSALQRARATLATRDLAGSRAPLSGAQALLVDRYVDAFERYDMSPRRTGGLSPMTTTPQSRKLFVNLLVADRFKDFTNKQICDTSKHTGALFALTAVDRSEVDALVHRAIDASGTHAQPPQDHGFMYAWSFYDLDGHHWEVFHMDASAIPPQQ